MSRKNQRAGAVEMAIALNQMRALTSLCGGFNDDFD